MMPLMLIMMKQVADQKKGQQSRVKKHSKKTSTSSCHPKINYEEEKEDIKPLMADDAVSRISCYDGPFQTTSLSNQDILEHTEDSDVNDSQDKYLDQINESWMIVKTPCLSGTICCTLISHKKEGHYTLHSNKEGYKVILLESRNKTTTTHIISTDSLDVSPSSYAILKSNIFSTNFYLYGSENSSKREELAAIICQTNVLSLRKQRKISVVLPCLPSECQDSSHLINYFDRKKRYGNFKTFILRKTFTESHKQNHFYLNGRNSLPEEKNFVLMDEKSSVKIMNFGRIDENAFNLEYSYPLCAIQAFGIALANLLSN